MGALRASEVWGGAREARREARADRLSGRPERGDAPAASFADLFREHEPDVRRLCRRMLGARGAWEDAAGEVFLRARRAFASYDAERPFRPWLLAVAGSYCIDQLRRRHTEARLFAEIEGEAGDLAGAGPSPLRHAELAEEREAVAAAIDALPARYRLPLVLRYFSDLDYDAIARILGVTRNQVGTLLFRARRRLRESLSGATFGGDR